jgi:hypothetical protein
VRGFTYCDLSGGNRLTSCSWVAERLISGQGASSSADPAADVSLAGTFVSLLRQQNKQRAVMVRQRKLTQRPMPDDDDDGQLSTDCARCAHLCYLTMVVSQVPVGHPRPIVDCFSKTCFSAASSPFGTLCVPFDPSVSAPGA